MVQAVNYRPAALGRNPNGPTLISSDSTSLWYFWVTVPMMVSLIASPWKMAGIDKDVKDTVPGVVYWERDANGDITGAAIETQWMQPYVDMGAWNPDVMVPETMERMQGFLATQGRHVGVGSRRDHAEFWYQFGGHSKRF